MKVLKYCLLRSGDQMKIKNINRRDFLQYLTSSAFALGYGCSNQTSPIKKNENNEPPPLNKTRIALVKTDNRSEGVKKVVEMLDFPSMQDKHVIVKPNFNTADPPPASTHNDTLSQIINEIKNRNSASITLAERSFQAFGEVISQKGIDQMADELNFTIKNLNSDEYTIFNEVDMNWESGFRLPKTISNSNYIVATCCLKTHHTGIITMSLKLAVGLIPMVHMQELHASRRVNSMIAEINLAYRPKLIIMDGVTTFIDGGPSHGTEKAGNVILAVTDRIAVDVVGTAILKELGSWRVSGKIFELEQIKRAAELAIGINSPERIEFITDDTTSRDYTEKLSEILANG